MIGAIIGAGLSVAGSVAGGISARKQAKKQAQMMAAEKARNQAWYDRRYNEDSTQRADAQAALTRMREAMAERSQRASGTAAVMGLSESEVAAEKEAQNQALAQTTSNIAAQGEARKDAVEAQYMERSSALNAQEMEMNSAKAQNTAGGIAGVLGAAGSIAGAFDAKDDLLNKIKPEKKVTSFSGFDTSAGAYGLDENGKIRVK